MRLTAITSVPCEHRLFTNLTVLFLSFLAHNVLKAINSKHRLKLHWSLPLIYNEMMATKHRSYVSYSTALSTPSPATAAAISAWGKRCLGTASQLPCFVAQKGVCQQQEKRLWEEILGYYLTGFLLTLQGFWEWL